MTDLDDVRDAITRIGGEVKQNKSDLNAHIKIEEIMLSNIDKNMISMLTEIKSQRISFDKSIQNQQTHIEEKISQCYKDMGADLRDNYYTKPEVLLIKDEAITKGVEGRKFDLEQQNEKLYKAAKSHLSIIWLAAVMFYGMAAWVFTDFKSDFKSHLHHHAEDET